MIKFEYDSQSGETFAVKNNFNVCVQVINVNEDSVDKQFEYWVKFMMSIGYNMSGYYLGNEKDDM